MDSSGVSLLIGAVVIAVSAELAARGKIRVNGGVGIRIPSVTASQEAWVKGHQAARPWLHMAAAALGTTALVSMVAERPTADIALLVGMVVALTDVVLAAVIAHRAASAVDAA